MLQNHLFFVTIVCLIPVLHVDASEDVEDECYFTVNDDCAHYNSAKVVSEFDGYVGALSGDGDYRQHRSCDRKIYHLQHS